MSLGVAVDASRMQNRPEETPTQTTTTERVSSLGSGNDPKNSLSASSNCCGSSSMNEANNLFIGNMENRSVANIQNTKDDVKITLSTQDDRDLFSDIDSSDDEADVSRQLHDLKSKHNASTASTGDLVGTHPRDEEHVRQVSKGTRHANDVPDGNKGLSKSQTDISSKSVSSSVPPAVKQGNKRGTGVSGNSTRSRSKQKPRKKVVLSASKKKRTKLVAKKTIRHSKMAMHHISSELQQELKNLTKMTRVQDLEKCHYNQKGEYLSSSRIPIIVMDPSKRALATKVTQTVIPSRLVSTHQVARNNPKYSWLLGQGGFLSLKKLGWTEDARLGQFVLDDHEHSMTLCLSRNRIQKVLNTAYERLHYCGVLNVNDESSAGKIEEEILIQKIHHNIEVLDSVDKSLVEQVEQQSIVPDADFDMSSSTHDEHADEMDTRDKSCSSGLGSTMIDVESLEAGTATPVSSKVTDKSVSDGSTIKSAETKVFRIAKYFPKYVGHSNELLITDQMLAFFSRPKLKITVQDHPNDTLTSEVQFYGTKGDVNAVLTNMIKAVQKKIIDYNSSVLLTNDHTLEIDVKFHVKQALGVKTTKGQKCLWIMNVQPGGQFQQIFGPRLNCGAAIVSMGMLKSGKMEPVTTNKAKNALIAAAQDELDQSNGDDCHKWIIARICLCQDACLADIDISRVVPRNNKVIQTRIGGPYHGKFFKNVSMATKDTGQMRALSNRSETRYTSVDSKKRKRLEGKIEGPKSSVVKKQKNSEVDIDGPEKVMTDKGSSYRHFRDKIQPVREIEFRNKLNGQVVTGSMWTQHKKLIGEHCDPNCKCVAHMNLLVKNIFADHTISEYKSGQKVGFAEYFCPKFFDKVQKYFPTDSAEQILQRLVNMWKQGHAKQLNLGGSCDPSCSCANLWSLLFLPICRGDSPQKLGRSHSIGLQPDVARSDNSNAFEITFIPSSTSLGFYCETQNIKGRMQCIVTSVDPGKKNVSKVVPGTVIDSYSTTKHQIVNVTSHQQLQNVFNLLKTRDDKTPLTIRFIKNMDLEKRFVIDCKRDWSETNSWIGNTSNHGWAGGAMVSKSAHMHESNRIYENGSEPKALGQKEKFLPQSAKNTIRDVLGGQKPGLSAPTKMKRCDTAIKEEVSSERQTGGRGRQLLSSLLTIKGTRQHASNSAQQKGVAHTLKSILHQKRKVKVNAKVQFDLSRNVTKVFIPDNIVLVQSQNKVARFSEEKLTEAIMCGQHLERFVVMLKHCVHDFKFEIPLNALTKRINELQEEEKNLDEEDISNSEKSERKRQIAVDIHQFDMKKKIVKIYAKAHHLLRTIGNTTPENIKINMIDHIENHHVEISKQIITVYDWLQRFRDEAAQEGKILDINADVDVYGVSLVHAAVFIGDSLLVTRLIQGGAKTKTSKSLGSPHQLSQSLLNQALARGNLTWTKKYMKVISVLENLKMNT